MRSPRNIEARGTRGCLSYKLTSKGSGRSGHTVESVNWSGCVKKKVGV